MRRKITYIIIGIVILAAVGALVLRSRKATAQTGTYTQVFAVQRGTLVASISPTGQVAAEKRVELGFDVSDIPLTELNVVTGQQVAQGAILAKIDPASLERAVDQAKADLLSAEEALEKAKNPHTELDRQKAELDVAQAQAALEEARLAGVDRSIRQAEFNLQSAQLNLTITQKSTTVGKAVRDLEYSVAWHERKLSDLQGQLQQNRTTQAAVDDQAAALAKARSQLASAQASAGTSLTTAQDKVTQAEEALAKLQSGPNALGALQVNNRIAQAEYNLAKAKDSLATVLAGPDTKTVQLAQARRDAAKASLDKAQATLDSAVMVAPFAGTVLSVGAEVGSRVSSNRAVVTLADLSHLEVLASVDETDIHNVEVGQEASITFDALSGSRFTGKVLEVPLEGTLSNNVVSYPVRVSLEGAQGASLRSGMTANVTIVVARRADALLVPVLAVQSSDDGDVVMLQDPVQGTTVATRVQVGLNDGTYVQVLRGLNEGDQVMVEYQSSTSQQQGFGVMGGFGSLVSGGSRVRVR